MLVLNPRQSQILSLARQTGNVTVDDLALRFDVTPQTIRKDLNDLCNNRLLARTHGGAMLSSGVQNIVYESRRQLASQEKRSIGQHAASLVPNNCSLFINIGTTTEEVARALVNHEGLLVITNNLHVATILASQPNIDDDGALLDFDIREVRAAQAIMSNSRNVILVSDAMKFSRSAPVRIGHISQVDVFVTDRPPPEAIIELCKNKGVRIDIVGNQSDDAGET
jgi:DeoR family transcriptional regulator, glycerol-3-phosphate regulon repressor